MIKTMFHKMNCSAINLRKEMILDLLEKDPEARVLDLGCDEGTWSLKLKDKISAKSIYGIEIVDERLKEAQEKGVIVKKSDLNERFPFEDNLFDVIHADQVIEHIAFLDKFIAEIYRVLKPGGYVVIGTENGSSWHNIFAAILGWQIFSLTNVSSKISGIGNPLAIQRGKKIDLDTWTHKTIFNYRGLKEFFEAYEFKNVKVTGSGYHPLPASFGKIDPRHSHYIILKGYK